MKIYRPLWEDGAALAPQQFQQQVADNVQAYLNILEVAGTAGRAVEPAEKPAAIKPTPRPAAKKKAPRTK